MMNLPTHVERTLDLGEQGCGQLVMEIKMAINTLKPGQKLLVIAHDPAAAGDIAAWCRMTGNILCQTPPNSTDHQFLIEKGPN